MAHTKARARAAEKRARFDEPPPDDAPDDEPMQLLDGEPVDLRDAWVMPGETEKG